MVGKRKRLLATCAALCVAGAVIYLAVAALDRGEATTDAGPLAGPPVGLESAGLMARAVDRADRGSDGRLLALAGGRPRPLEGELSCERVYYAGGRGLCLAGTGGGGSEVTIFDSAMRPSKTLPLSGLPSRARVSADGRYGATTVFVDGHAYEKPGGFSTVTTLYDMHSGTELGSLEEFEVRKNGRRFEAVDFNFWGATFSRANPDRFYATLHTGPHYYLVEGSVFSRTLRVLRDGVECPSLSPDGTRIAFKSRLARDRWRLRVLDLDTLKDHPVAERRSIDDQAEWLDDSTLVYSDGLDLYAAPADGSGASRLILRNASSPVSLSVGLEPRRKPGAP
ncbi:MAG TPA: hypothetical protein VJ989_04825 [Solirubrobacterales bacterium]|nr:hypothetical protein [Solirubrobacterales bacterium]